MKILTNLSIEVSKDFPKKNKINTNFFKGKLINYTKNNLFNNINKAKFSYIKEF